jgi:CubicO group peptidase (beta-lactamase class C family)
VSAPEAVVDGTVADGWEPLREVFQRHFDAGWEIGAAVAVYHRGRKVVDLWGGRFDEAGSQPYTDDSLQLVFSTTKGLGAIALALCAQRGLLDYDAPVADCWPEFAAGGKERITVAQLVSHQAGLPVVDGPVTLEQALDWDHMVGRLAAQAPLWEAGTAHGYHALTFGWLAGELVRRVDPQGRSLGGFVADEVVGPVQAECWIGLPEAEERRVSPLVPVRPSADAGVVQLMRQLTGPETLIGRALTLNGAFPFGSQVWNSRAVRAAEIPSANGVTNAASLARIYAACVDEVAGVRLLDPETVARVSATATTKDEPDRVLVFPSTFGMGFMTSGMFTPMLGPGSFGHAGAGGSLAFAHPGAGIGFGYVMNRMDSTLNGDVRALGLVHAVKDVLTA